MFYRGQVVQMVDQADCLSWIMRFLSFRIAVVIRKVMVESK